MKHILLSVCLTLAALAGGVGRLPAKDVTSALELAKQLNQAFIEVADLVSPSVVVIRVAHRPDYIDLEMEEDNNDLLERLPPEFRKWFRQQAEPEAKPRPRQPRRRGAGKPIFDGQGSGVVMREDGYILTNRHVVDGADKILVRFADGKEYPAEIRGVDKQSDIAVIKIEASQLKAAKLGDSAKTRVGEFAIAIGAPFDLDYSVTFGHVSAKGRTHVIDGREGQAMDQDFIQTDANINPGNSGGPLVNISGEGIGINTLIRGLRTGIGFAIPSNLAREIADKLISDGKYVRSWLGIGSTALKDFPDFRDTVTGVTDGVVVTVIPPNTPASKSELRTSDIITAVDGKSVANVQQLRKEVRAKPAGETLTLDVRRGERNLKIKVKTEAWPDEPTEVAGRRNDSPPDAAADLGLTVKTLTKELAEEFSVEKTEGVIVTGVERDSLAASRGFKPGDIITGVNQKPVTTTKQFREALKGANLKKGVVLNYLSEGTSRFQVLKESGD